MIANSSKGHRSINNTTNGKSNSYSNSSSISNSNYSPSKRLPPIIKEY